jgi:hypothetical protein
MKFNCEVAGPNRSSADYSAPGDSILNYWHTDVKQETF